MRTECPHCAQRLDPHTVIGVQIRGVYDGVLFWKCRARKYVGGDEL